MESAVGRAHHIALQMDGRFRIAAGCFSSNEEKNINTGALLNICADRVYENWRQFLQRERGRLDAVLLLTPTPSHAEMAAEVLALGFPLISEKALSVTSAEAASIRAARIKHDGFVAVTYNYSGYPIVRELRNMIANGSLGELTHVAAEMPQEGFLRLVGSSDSKPQPQAWRLKDAFIPTVSLDLGVHLHHLIKFLTRASPIEVCALEQHQGHFDGIVDNVQCIARYTGELPVQLWYGKTSLGFSNGLRIRVFGSKASAEWVQMNAEHLTLNDNRGNTTIITRSSNDTRICSNVRYNRFKPGHPAGFIEAFANYYSDVADWLTSYLNGYRVENEMVAGVEVAEEGLIMMEAIARSARTKTWQSITTETPEG